MIFLQSGKRIYIFFVCSHVGDLGNIVADQNGAVDIVIEDRLVSLSGPNSVIGRAFVVRGDKHTLIILSYHCTNW